MNIQQNVPLRNHSTMRLGGITEYSVEVTSRIELEEALRWADEHNLPALMIGDGSNIIWRDEGFGGLLIVNKIQRYEKTDQGSDCYITVGAGENWDNIVEKTVADGLTGIEYLSLIPGTAGATPVQNVGAYGQEISNVLVSVEAFDNQEKKFVSIPGFECDFGYRTSRFKTTDRGRFFITAINLHLRRGNPEPPFYRALERHLSDHNVTDFTPQSIRQAVIDIRRSKLPDPAQVANNGSFFGNPIVDEATFIQLQANYPDMPHWPTSSGKVKLSAAWMLEAAGFKDFHDTETGMSTWPRQPLVLVNESAKSTAQLLEFKQKIVGTVQAKFGITLEQEPELLP